MQPDATFWNGVAEKYAQQPVANPDAYARKLDATRALLSSEHVVLDLGCGTGSLAIELAPHVAKVHSWHISHEMLEIARRKVQDASISNIIFHEGTLEDAHAFHTRPVHMVCAYNILHLVPDPQAAIRAIFDVLVPGGIFIASTPCLGDSWVPYRPLLTTMRWLGKAPHVMLLKQRRFMDGMSESGFADIQAVDVGASSTTLFSIARKP